MPKKTYKIGEDIYDIEESDVSSFLKQAPNAKEVKSFLIGKDTFDVEIPDVDAFLKQVPDAKPLFDEVKKKEQAMPVDGQQFGGKSKEPLLPLTSSTASPSVSKKPKSIIPSEFTDGKSKQAPFQNVDISRPELEVAKYDKVQERNRIQNYSQGLQKVQIDAEKKIRQRDELLAGIEQMQVDLEASKGNPEQYNALIPQYNELVNNAKSLTNEISSDFNKMDIFEKGIGVTELKRQINEDTIGNRALEGVNNAKRIVLEAFPATAQVASYLTMRSRGIDPQTAEKVSTDIVENGFPNLKRWSRELAEENEDLRSVFDQTTAWDVLTEKDKSLLEKDWAKIGELSAKELVQTLPTTLAIMGTYINPIAGATTTIMGTAGMELEEMQGSNMTPDAKIANALTKGGLEYATEKVFGSIPMLKRAIGMKSKAGQEAYQNIVLETWNKFASKMGFAADVIEEVGSEMLNTIGGNYTDYLSGKTTEADLYKGLGETFTTSLTMASTLSGAGRAVKYGNKKINELRNATKKLKEISESQETTPEVLQVIQDKIVENNEKIAAEAKVEKKVFDSMDDKTWSETTTLIQETQSLEQQLENNEVPEDVIPLVEDKIKEGYEKIDELTKKAKENAIQEPSTGEVLQRQQEEAGITGSERTGVEQGEQGEEVAQEGQAKEEVVKTFSPKEIESGKQEVDAIKTGKTETTNPIRLFKGLFGKRNPDGTRKTAHSGVKGVFSAVDEKIAEKYKGEDGVGTFDIPSGTTIEVIEVKDRNVPMSKFRQQETDAINNSDAQIVKLITMDARGAEEQYIIKDPALIEKMQRPEAQEVIKEREVSEAKKVSALRDVESAPSENKASEPSKSDKNYQDAQNINSIVSKENPDVSVLIQPKGDNLVLTAIYVGKGKRRGGIGSKALETIKREAKKLGKKVVLDATNELDQKTDLKRLGNFYERNGFKKVGENTYEYDPKNEASSGDTGARTDNTGAEVGDTASVTDKGESGKEAIAEEEVDAVKKGKKEFPKNVLAIAEETGLSPQQIENTYKKYDGSKDIEEITIEDYNNARATGDKAKLEVSAKAFDALLQQENAKTSTSPTAKKNAEKSLKEADEKALKEASKIMEHINEIRAKLQESGIIKSTSCKWGK